MFILGAKPFELLFSARFMLDKGLRAMFDEGLEISFFFSK
jgi:hypothetical protein